MNLWLLETAVAEAMQQAVDSGVQIQPEAREKHAAALSGRGDRIMQVAGGRATISVRGILTPQPDLFALLFGGANTTYAEIRSALADAEANGLVADVDLIIDSPGGTVAGLFSVLDDLRAMSKPVRARVAGRATSAAYAIAAASDTILAENRAAAVGSIGVAAVLHTSEHEHVITNTESPNKRPDPRTEEGRKAVEKELDEVYALFAEYVSEGRGVDVDTVTERFGRGGTFLADEAKKRGMIDAVQTRSLSVVENDPDDEDSATVGGSKRGDKSMDLETLKAQHPDVYAAAVKTGQEQERDRVVAHLNMGQTSGDMETAAKAIESGDGMTATLQSKYMSAAMNRRDVANRQDDDAQASDAAAAAAGGEPVDETDFGDRVAARLTSSEVV